MFVGVCCVSLPCVRSCGLGLTPVFEADWAFSVFLHSFDLSREGEAIHSGFPLQPALV